MAHRPHFTLTPSAAALALLFAAPAWAQTGAPTQRLDAVTVSAKAAPVLDTDHADVGGFGQSLAKTPQSITVLGADLLAATASSSLSQAIKLDASLADSYNTIGYIEGLTVRGFLLDAGTNFLRNGLRISNYAPIAMENKERVEVLKGVAGLQSGVSAPGGLVNFVTKTPQRDAFTTVSLGADGNGGSKVHLDSNTAWGGVGVRVNLAAEDLRTQFDRADGKREFASVALATNVAPGTKISADLEYHHKKQPSVPGLGLLDTNGDGVADTLPAPVYGRLNLNNQSWSLPFEATGTNAQFAIDHQINADWQARLGLGMQRTIIQDRLAFPDGCSTGPNRVYPGLCANGDVDIYDYRSEGEERSTWAWDAKLNGKLSALGVQHRLSLGLSGRSAKTELNPTQAYNFVGTTNINTPIALRADPSANDLNTNSRERAIDVSASLVSDLTATVQSFVGLRTTRLTRSSERSDGSRAISFEQTVTTPWAGLSWSPVASTMLYASWGQGVELEAVPNRPTKFVNAGEVLPALKSEQTEVGVKWQPHPRLLVSTSLFSIDKPFADDLPTASGIPLRVAGGKTARHRGVELSAVGQVDTQLSLQASLTLLDAKYTAAVDPSLVGRQVTNVPKAKASLFADYKIAAVPGLSINGLLTSESGKTVTADGSVALPSAWQLDAGLRYQNHLIGKVTQWNLFVENLTDRSYWREAPTQYWGGTYLFPSTLRTVRARVTVEF
ncbi:MAG: TonB-dependent siderophore receptor [Burkholderiales bacterium]|nr:TonB-dependent siderophore receptor [Burkholderiales bacterium]